MKINKSVLSAVLVASALITRGNAQNTSASATAMPIESEMIAYEAIGTLAHQVKEAAGGEKLSSNVLYGNAANLASITAYQGFLGVGDQLIGQYQASVKPLGPGILSGPGAVSDVVKTMSDILNSLKAGGTQSSATFAPVEQVLISDLEKEFKDKLITFACPYKYADGNKRIANKFRDVAAAREKAFADLKQQKLTQAAQETDPDIKKKLVEASKSPAEDPAIKPIEAVFASFQSTLSGANANAVIQGAVLTASLGDPYEILTITTAAAGGGDRANTYFLYNLLFPPLHHSYNGGAVLAFTLRQSGGQYVSGGTLRQVYGYEKWHQPKLRGGPARLTP